MTRMPGNCSGDHSLICQLVQHPASIFRVCALYFQFAHRQRKDGSKLQLCQLLADAVPRTQLEWPKSVLAYVHGITLSNQPALGHKVVRAWPKCGITMLRYRATEYHETVGWIADSRVWVNEEEVLSALTHSPDGREKAKCFFDDG